MNEDKSNIFTNYLVAEFDEMNAIYRKYREKTVDDDIIPEIVQYAVYRFMQGRETAYLMVGEVVDTEPDIEVIYDAVYQVVGDKTISDRLKNLVGVEYVVAEGDIDDIIRSDGHRCFILGQEHGAKELERQGASLLKKWNSILDGAERETHRRLHGTRIALGEYFVTENGRATAPGLFGVAEEDCNCRCILTIERSE